MIDKLYSDTLSKLYNYIFASYREIVIVILDEDGHRVFKNTVSPEFYETASLFYDKLNYVKCAKYHQGEHEFRRCNDDDYKISKFTVSPSYQVQLIVRYGEVNSELVCERVVDDGLSD